MWCVYVCVYLRESHVDEVESALETFRDDHPSTSRGTHGPQQEHRLRRFQSNFGVRNFQKIVLTLISLVVCLSRSYQKP